MRKYLAYALLAALSMPAAVFADDHDRRRDEHRDAHEWHHHRHIYSDSYYMSHPRAFYEPAPVVVAPAPVMIAPPPPSFNIVIPIH
jgi:hypothetical protein